MKRIKLGKKEYTIFNEDEIGMINGNLNFAMDALNWADILPGATLFDEIKLLNYDGEHAKEEERMTEQLCHLRQYIKEAGSKVREAFMTIH